MIDMGDDAKVANLRGRCRHIHLESWIVFGADSVVGAVVPGLQLCACPASYTFWAKNAQAGGITPPYISPQGIPRANTPGVSHLIARILS